MKLALVYLVLGLINVQLIAEHQDHKQKLKELDFLLGEWHIEVDARLSNGTWDNSVGKSTIRRTLDSAMIEEEFTGVREGKRFLSKTLFAFNNLSGKYQRVFIDSPHGVLVEFEGLSENQLITFIKEVIPAGGKPVALRVLYRRLSADSFSLESQRRPRDTDAWDTTGRMRYSKMKTGKD
jgi:hypothetical protein